jgi:hypothetical protein
MMGLPAGWVTDVIETRSQALKALGNGCVPDQAIAAVSSLLNIHEVRHDADGRRSICRDANPQLSARHIW